MEVSGRGNQACREARLKGADAEGMWERVGSQRCQGFSEQVPSRGKNGKQGGGDGWEVEPRILEVATGKSQVRGVPPWKVTEPEGCLELLELKRHECHAC